jgi:hypothetical protein
VLRGTRRWPGTVGAAISAGNWAQISVEWAAQAREKGNSYKEKGMLAGGMLDHGDFK